MTTPNVQLRRATVEDLAKLVELWKKDSLPSEELEKRLTEFQLVEAVDGTLLAAVGFEIKGHEGRLHSEAFADHAQANIWRERLWERTQNQAKNHGLVRIWTQLQAPFWGQNGLQAPDEATRAKLPEAFGGSDAPWASIQLREEKAMEISLDKEFALFKESEQEATQKIFRQARVLKLVALVLAVALAAVVVVWAVFFMRLQQGGTS